MISSRTKNEKFLKLMVHIMSSSSAYCHIGVTNCFRKVFFIVFQILSPKSNVPNNRFKEGFPSSVVTHYVLHNFLHFLFFIDHKFFLRQPSSEALHKFTIAQVIYMEKTKRKYMLRRYESSNLALGCLRHLFVFENSETSRFGTQIKTFPLYYIFNRS